MLVLSSVACLKKETKQTQSEQTPTPTVSSEQTSQPDSEQTPTPTVASEQTSQPDSEQTPTPTVSSEQTSQPDSEQTPTPTVSSEQTSQPQNEQSPTPTAGSEQTSQPKSEQTPTPTVAAQQTSQPKSEQTPTPTVAAQQTSQPKSEQTPTPTVAYESWQKPSQRSGGIALPISKEPITYEMMLVDHPTNPVKDTFIFPKEIYKRTNIQLKLLPTPGDGYDQKISIALASGSIPDLIVVPTNGFETANRFGPKGVFLNIWDYFDKMPNFQRVYNAYKMAIDEFKYSKNQLYAIPNDFNEKNQPPSKIHMIRTDVLKSNNLSVPKTYDELYNVLKTLRSAYTGKGVYPWSNRNGIGNIIEILSPAWGVPTSWYEAFLTYDASAKTVDLCANQPNFKAMMEFIAKCYKEELLDKEFVLNSSKQWVDKMQNNKAFYAIDWMNRCWSITDAARKAGNSSFELMAILPPKPDVKGGSSVVRPFSTFNLVTVANAKVKKPEVFAKLIDYMYYSEEGVLLAKWGLEGEHYTYADKDGKVLKFVENIKTEYNPSGTIAADHDYGINYNGFKGVNPDFFSYKSFRLEGSYQTKVEDVYRIPGVTALVRPKLLFTDDEQEIVSEYEAPLRDYVEIELIKFAIGDKDFSEWDKFKQELNKKVGTKLVETYNKALKRKFSN